ncbi:MAG: ATP-binding protein [Schwartzia sp.]|nr:ATP-binding protein [Schwartzia sp. (in: firmicutes)]
MSVMALGKRIFRKNRMNSDVSTGVCKVGASLQGIRIDIPMNPCPCGNRFSEDSSHVCTCTPTEIKRYTRKISGPLLDRIDIHIRVSQVAYKDLSSRQKAESSASIRERVSAARKRQMERLQPFGIFMNSQMNHAMLKEQCPLDSAAQNLLEMAFKKMSLSARSYDRIIKVARTIADLDGAENIDAKHIGEAVQMRNDVGLSAE